MNWLPWVIALCWIPFSFLLHNMLHELAHAAEAIRNGAKITKIWPFPGMQLGYWTWAHVKFSGIKKMTALLSLAPVLVELVWLVIFSTLFLFTDGWLQKIVLVEMISSNVDMTNWLLAWWRKIPNPSTDAERFRNDLGWTLGKAKVVSLLQIVVYLLCVVVVIAGMV